MFFSASSWQHATEPQVRELTGLGFRPPTPTTLRQMIEGLGIYEAVLVREPVGIVDMGSVQFPAVRRFIPPPLHPPQVEEIPEWSVDGLSTATVGVDCGILAEFQAVLQLLGPDVRLVFASDNDPAVAKLFAEKYGDQNSCRWFSDVQRVGSGEAAPRCQIYIAGFPCQPFSSAGKGRGCDDPRGQCFFHCRDYIDSQRPELFFSSFLFWKTFPVSFLWTAESPCV